MGPVTKAPKREVVRVIDVEGERGCVIHVLVLTCGHWLTRRAAPRSMAVSCLGCVVAAAMKGSA